MERHRLRNILTLVLFSCDLLVTQEIIYKTLGTTVELVCPIANTTRPITWFGPLNYKIYAVGMDVSQDVATQVDINETEADKKSILLIHRFTKEKSGKYKCSNFDDKRDFTLIIKNPPSVKLLNHTFSSFDIQRNIQCIVSGDPMEYTYGKWEHKSFFNEHVRYLNGTSSGLLILPLQEKRVRYQDSGIYVCSVSNGVPDKNGNYFQKEYSYVFSKGPPVFVMNNKRIQYGNIGKPMDLMVYVQSWLNITNHSVATAVREIQHLKVAIYHIKIKDTFHGQLIQLFGWKIVFRFHKSTIDQFQNYTIIISNELGSADFVTELKSKDKNEIVETSISVQSIVIVSLVVIIVILMAGIVIHVYREKHRNRERIEPAINVHTPEETFGESAHYSEIIEIDNLQPSSQENDIFIMAMVNRDIDVVSVEHTSTSSANDNDSLEYLDDGYEKPYTTLVVTEDDHVYLTTKQKSDYENTSPFQNVDRGHACEILEEDSLSDKTNAHDDHENWHLNYGGNEFNETNESVPQTYINLQMNTA